MRDFSQCVASLQLVPAAELAATRTSGSSAAPIPTRARVGGPPGAPHVAPIRRSVAARRHAALGTVAGRSREGRQGAGQGAGADDARARGERRWLGGRRRASARAPSRVPPRALADALGSWRARGAPGAGASYATREGRRRRLLVVTLPAVPRAWAGEAVGAIGAWVDAVPDR